MVACQPSLQLNCRALLLSGMKRVMLAGLCVISVSAHADSCESMAGLAGDVWLEFKETALKAGCVLPSKSHDVAMKFFYCSAAKIQTGLVDGMVGWWNTTAQNRWATIGARTVGPEWQEGTLVSTTGRTFTTLAPQYSKTKVLLEKLDGKAETEVTICGFDESGRSVKVAERRIDPKNKKLKDPWVFDVSNAAGKVLTIKLDAKSVGNTFNYRIRVDAEPIKWESDKPITGFADLHVHQAAELSSAGNYYWGSHTGKINAALSACHDYDKTDLLNTITGNEAKNLHAIPFGVKMKELGNIRHGEGHPGFTSWPHYTDIAHQQVHAEWLKQAHDGGLKLLVVSAVNNEPMCRLLRTLYPNRNSERSCEDMDNVKRQIQAFIDFEREHDWYRIAVHPWHARKIISEGKLAVVISVEASNLFPRTEGDFTKQLDELYAMGARTLQPVHETDSRFAGAAPQRSAFEIMQTIKWPGKLAGEIIDGRLRGFNVSCNNKNCVGMASDGARLTDAMVQRRMLIDTAHMSELAFKQYYDYLTEKYKNYPLYNSHARFKSLLDKGDKKILKEFLVNDVDAVGGSQSNIYSNQIEMYKRVGGMVGIRTGFEHMLDAKVRVNGGDKPVTNNCPGSSRSIAQMVDYADQSGLKIAFGSDLNGNTYQTSPRFGLEKCYANRILNKGHVGEQGNPPGEVSREFNEHGLAHIGLLPELLKDLKVLKTPGVKRLDDSAEEFIRMWERAYEVKLAVATNEKECKEDTDCADGWYCNTGVAGVGVNKCKAKLQDGQRCTQGHQCQSGNCNASICYTPASVILGGSCLVNDQCKSGACTSLDGVTKGKCVCKEDSHCPAGEYCNTGVGGIGTNVCKDKLSNGALCTKDHQCQAGRCKTGFCSAEASVNMGGSCRFDDECKRGTCTAPIGGATKGKCVCTQDSHCDKGEYCNTGVGGIGTNVCKAKLDKGKLCTKDHQCKSNECKLTCR